FEGDANGASSTSKATTLRRERVFPSLAPHRIRLDAALPYLPRPCQQVFLCRRPHIIYPGRTPGYALRRRRGAGLAGEEGPQDSCLADLVDRRGEEIAVEDDEIRGFADLERAGDLFEVVRVGPVEAPVHLAGKPRPVGVRLEQRGRMSLHAAVLEDL